MTRFAHRGRRGRRGAGRTGRWWEAHVVGQGARFALVGGVVAAIYLGATTLLSQVVGLPFELALGIGFCLALVVHFALQRAFVWRTGHGFALSVHSQIGRYSMVAAAQYGVTAASTAVLPGALGIATEAVYLSTVGVIVILNFIIFRQAIFHARAGDAQQ